MSAATFASYVIGKLSGSDAATSSMASRTSPTPRLTTVWRTKSIPYDVPRTEPQTFKSDGSLLKILRTKSMPSLNLEDDIPGRSLRPMSPLSIGSPVSSRSASPLPMVRSRAVNPRLDRNTVTPPPSPSLSNPALSSPPQRRRLERTTSDGALLVKRRQKRSEFENEFPSGGTPSVRALKSVFDAKSDESMTNDRSPLSPKGKSPLPSPTKSAAVVGQTLKKEPEAVTRQVKPVRHGSLEHYERAEEKKTTPTVKEVCTSQPSFKEILRRFQQPDKPKKEATTLQTHKLPRETARQVNIVVEEKTLIREVQSEPKLNAHVSVSRQRSKSEPEPNTKRPHVLASPVSVKRLKMQFESQGVKDSFASPMLLPPRREPTKLKKQFAVRHSSSESEDDVFDMDLPCAVKKPEPMMIEAAEASSVTPSVSNLRQQFEKAASAQSFSKTVGRDDVTVRRIQWSTTQDMRAPFESTEQNKEVQRERTERPSLSEINSQNTVKNLLQQFQTTTPDQPLEEMTNKFSFETRESTHLKEVSKSDVKSYIKSYEASNSPQTRHRSLDGEESELPRRVESSGHGAVTHQSPVQRRRSSSSSSDDSSDSQEPDDLLLSVKRGSAEREQQIEDYWRNKEEMANRRKENEKSYGYRDTTDADRHENEKLLQKQRLTRSSLHSESEEEDQNTSGEDEARGQNIDIKEEIEQMEILVKEALTAPPQTNKAEDTHSKIDTLITDFEKNQNQKQDSRVRSSSVLSEDLGLESSHGKVGHLIDKFANVRDADSDSDSSDGEEKGNGKKSSATRSEDTAIDASPGKVGHLIDKFAKVQKDSTSEEDEDKDKADEEPRERRESDITSLIDKFAKINNPRVKSASTSSDSDAEKPPAAEKEKPPVPTIPTKSIPGKVRTLNPDELQFFGMGGSSEPFVRSQSLRVKKADPQPFYPRGGSLRVKKSEPLPVIPAAKKLPRNCRNLKPDELRFFDMGNNNNVYGNLTSKSNSQNSSCASTPTTEKEDAFNNNNNNKTPNDVQFFQ
ncbi:uncharacterized protein LOC134771028 [Penaeus indicus]|uniref:uncharacterized protein LOC134771028 n=1 Tax=Penaeus indicus TaxID=29960 RepID=UPI00300CABAD